MLICVDFDGTVVEKVADTRDVIGALTFVPGARRGLRALRRADHTLVLYSARANRALRLDPMLDPLIRSGAVPFDLELWRKNAPHYQARYEQMLVFVEVNLPGVFAAIDDGEQGKPLADLFIDDRAIHLVPGSGWSRVAEMYGD